MNGFRPVFWFFLLIFWQNCQSDAVKQSVSHPPPQNAENLHPNTHQSEDDGMNSLVSDFENPNRAIWQKPDMVINLLGDLEGKTVADIGAGTGYFAFRMVPKARRVIAIEIDPRLVNFMDSVKIHLSETLRFRFETRLGKPENPLLAPAEADAVTIVNTYGYIENRVEYLKILRKGMSKGATLLVIDFKKDLPVGPSEQFKASLLTVENELQKAGFEMVRQDTRSLDFQYIVVARNPR